MGRPRKNPPAIPDAPALPAVVAPDVSPEVFREAFASYAQSMISAGIAAGITPPRTTAELFSWLRMHSLSAPPVVQQGPQSLIPAPGRLSRAPVTIEAEPVEDFPL